MEQLLAKEIVRTLEDDRAFVTITHIRIDARMETAQVSVSVFPDEQREGVLGMLNRHSRPLEHFLLKKMSIKRIPHLVFK